MSRLAGAASDANRAGDEVLADSPAELLSALNEAQARMALGPVYNKVKQRGGIGGIIAICAHRDIGFGQPGACSDRLCRR